MQKRKALEEKARKGNASDLKPRVFMQGRVFNRRLKETLDSNLLHATQRKQWKRAFSLLEAGAKPCKRDEFEYTALTYAAEGGRKGLVESMVENGVKISILDNASRAAYIKALLGGHREIAELLLNAGDFLDEHVEQNNAPKMTAEMKLQAIELLVDCIDVDMLCEDEDS